MHNPASTFWDHGFDNTTSNKFFNWSIRIESVWKHNTQPIAELGQNLRFYQFHVLI